MLLTINLQLNEFATFDTDLDSPQLLPPLTTEPRVAFADVLKMGAELAADTTIADGQLLPASGNELPPWPVTNTGALLSGDETVAAAGTPAGLVPLAALPAASAAMPVIAATATLSTLQGAVPGLPPAAGNGLPEAASQRAPAVPVLPDASAATVDARDGTQAGFARRSAALLAATPQSAAMAALSPSAALREQQAAPLATLAEHKLADDQQRLAAKLPRAAGPALQPATALQSSVTNDSGHVHAARDSMLPPGPALQVTAAVPQTAPTGSLDALLPQDAQPFTQQPVPASAQTATQASPGTAGTSAAAQSIDVPVRDAAWGEQIGQRVQLMVSNRLQTAEIRLTPAELGPLRIQLAVDDGAASVTFHAASAVTRDAIEQALPRLREMLTENGLTLSQADIGEQGVQHGGREHRDDASTVAFASGDASGERDGEVVTAAAHGTSDPSALVDMFA